MMPHVTQFDEADITALEQFRVEINQQAEQNGVKVTVLAFLIKASVDALKQFPTFNSSLDGENLIVKHYYHIGFAADTPNGLVVPVIRNADQKSVLAIAREAGELAKKAREGKLSPAEMQGGCFSISQSRRHRRHGVYADYQRAGSRHSRVSKADMKPKWDGKRFAPPHAAAVAVLRPPPWSMAPRARASSPTWDSCWSGMREALQGEFPAAEEVVAETQGAQASRQKEQGDR